MDALHDITIRPELRECTVNGKPGYFHCWEHYSNPIEPEVVGRPRTVILSTFDPIDFKKEIVTTTGDTIVSCSNRDRCAAIYEYMEGLGKC